MVRTTSTDRLKGYGKNTKSAKIQTEKGTMSRKATLKKEFRQRERLKKHFNGPIQQFLEIKYPEIYGEYKELYALLSANHPQTRDLTKTCTFKTWQCTVHRQGAETVSESVEITPDQNNNDSQAMHGTTETASESVEITPDQNNNDTQAMHGTTETTNAVEIIIPRNDNDSQAMHGTTETASESVIRVDMNELIDIVSNVEGQVDQIISELRQDHDLRAIFDEPEIQPEDEGIEINPLEDVEYDIEPFDFDVEVENYFW